MAARRRDTWVLLLVLLALVGLAQGVQIIAGTPSTFTTIYSPEHLVVALHDEASKLGRSLSSSGIQPGVAARPMTDKDGRQFVCYLPPKGPATEDATQLVTPPVDFIPEVKTPFELLERLSTLCLYRQEGLWTYEMCYKKHARQFRQGNGDVKGEDYSCGSYTGDEEQVEEIKVDTASPADARLRYVSHNMTGGAPCALSGSGRTTEVRFTCHKDLRENVIVSVREFPTCNYIFTVSTPFLCKHPQFKPPDEVLRTLNCVPTHVSKPVPVEAKEPAPSDSCSIDGAGQPTCSAGGTSEHAHTFMSDQEAKPSQQDTATPGATGEKITAAEAEAGHADWTREEEEQALQDVEQRLQDLDADWLDYPDDEEQQGKEEHAEEQQEKDDEEEKGKDEL